MSYQAENLVNHIFKPVEDSETKTNSSTTCGYLGPMIHFYIKKSEMLFFEDLKHRHQVVGQICFSLTVFNGLKNVVDQIFSLIGHVNEFLAFSAPPFWVSTAN